MVDPSEGAPAGVRANVPRWRAAAERLAQDAATSLPLTAAIYVASGSILAGVVVAAFVLALGPIVRAFAARVRKLRG